MGRVGGAEERLLLSLPRKSEEERGRAGSEKPLGKQKMSFESRHHCAILVVCTKNYFVACSFPALRRPSMVTFYQHSGMTLGK